MTQKFHSRNLTRRNENIFSHKDLYVNVQSSIHKSQKVETTPMFMWWVNKQNAVYPYNGILFANKKERNTDIWYNVYEPKNNVLSYVQCPEKANL